ncbi:unnamed protein product [Spirodela intermedia]|uniref:Malectin-like domain-containing protein n=1 Tax=Spirodela intermedia TaxID=51605 RepID=A0A7I8INQ1_SPIIN|nr:unnamed protein product [Spirodela intermedia]CAA6659439.1 unnamed protein product [Spirodela intermedia]
MTPSSTIFFFFFLLFFSVSALPPQSFSTPSLLGFFINCGAEEEITTGGIKWLTDEDSSPAGTDRQWRRLVSPPPSPPSASSPTRRRRRTASSTTYFYGGFDGGATPPCFDQIVGGTRWSTVNTSGDYTRGLASYYEVVVRAAAKTLSVCLARNGRSTAAPFISALEVAALEDSIYNSTDLDGHLLATVARHRFGHAGAITSYPEDPFNRYWEPFPAGDGDPVVESHANVSAAGLWNLPPAAAFQRGITASRGSRSSCDNRTPSPFSWRVFDVSLNGEPFYPGLNVSATGVMVFSGDWPLSGKTEITLTPAPESPVGPVINAGEVLQLVPGRGGPFFSVIAMEELARSLTNVPADWNGDPCLPWETAWTGVECSRGSLPGWNLTRWGLTGTLPEGINNMTALTSIWLGGNMISGPIPDLGSLQQLVSLRLEDNQLSGPIPPSLGSLMEIRRSCWLLIRPLSLSLSCRFLQNNDLQGPIPQSLTARSGINIQISPGNNKITALRP